jgi:phosphohistidine phosphatase
MRLYLVQHGEALPKDVDPDRPLSEKGRDDARRLARFLGGCGIRVSRVLHSGKTRARETAELLASTVLPGKDVETSAGLDPNDPVGAMAERVGAWEQDVLVVGHLPFMDELVARLVTGSEGRGGVAFKPASLVCLERGEQGDWRIVLMLRPEFLGRQTGALG